MTTRSRINKAVKKALLASTAATLALGNPLIAAEEEEEQEEDNKIVVVGSRLKRNQVEGAQPILIISNEDMKKEGYTTVFDALDNLATNNGIQIEGPEFAGGFTPDIQTLNIRGFGIGNTLTLINGRRVANYPAAYQGQSSATNFGAIPQAAIERIEVLSGGGSSIYGSDAVAGVINIVLKEDYDETQINVLFGRPQEASGDDLRVDIVSGHTFDNGNITGGFSYRRRDPISAGDYDQFDSNLDYPYSDYQNPRLSISTYVLDRFAFELVDPGEGTCEGFGATRFLFSESLGYMCGTDDIADTNFRNKREQYSAFLNGNYTLDNGVELFGEFLYNKSESQLNRTNIFIQERIFNGANYYTVTRSFSEQDLSRSLDSFFEDESFNISFGARGNWGEHDWELSAYRSQYELESRRERFTTQGAIDVFFGDFFGFFGGRRVWEGNGTFGLFDNLFAEVNDSNRDMINSAIGTQTYGNETSSTGMQFVLTGDAFEMPAGPVSYAAVFEYEKQKLSFKPDALISQLPPFPYTSGSGWLGLTGYDGTGDRDRFALGFEASLPITEKVNLNLAARADKYDKESSSIGTRVTPSLTLEYRPTDALLLRAGYSESFRAPDLVQVYSRTGFYQTVTDFTSCYQGWINNGGTAADFDSVNCTGTQIFARRVGPSEVGNTPLKDETGESVWAGFVYDVTDNLSIQTDFVRTSLEDKVATESTTNILRTEWLCGLSDADVAAVGFEAPSAAACTRTGNQVTRAYDDVNMVDFITEFNVSPINISEESVEGMDVKLTYGVDTDFGRFGFRADYSYLLSHKFDGDELRDDPILGGWEPRSNLNMAVSYANGDFGATLSGIRRGSTTRYRPTSSVLDENDSVRINPYFNYNMTLNYNWTNNLSTRLSIINLFDQSAPEDKSIGPSDFPWYNNFIYGGSAIGRQIYVEASYTL